MELIMDSPILYIRVMLWWNTLPTLFSIYMTLKRRTIWSHANASNGSVYWMKLFFRDFNATPMHSELIESFGYLITSQRFESLWKEFILWIIHYAFSFWIVIFCKFIDEFSYRFQRRLIIKIPFVWKKTKSSKNFGQKKIFK